MTPYSIKIIHRVKENAAFATHAGSPSCINICKKGTIKVEVIPKDEVKNYKRNKTKHEKSTDYTKVEIDLSLPAPIITAWAYQLAKSLHTGIQRYYQILNAF